MSRSHSSARHGGDASFPPVVPGQPSPPRTDWATLRRLFPYLWEYKYRVMAALAFMVGAKTANVSVPLLLKQLIDTMNPKAAIDAHTLLVVPVALLFAYGLL